MYVARMQRAAAMGERVIIDGNCLSACTMTLGIIPPQNVCATPRAVLGFHSAFTPTPLGQKVDYPPGTLEMVSHYPPAIRAWIKRHGGLHPSMIYLRAPEIFQYVSSCQWSHGTDEGAEVPHRLTCANELLRLMEASNRDDHGVAYPYAL